MMAPRRSAARSARLEAGLGDGGATGVSPPAGRLAGLVAAFLVFLVFLVASFVMPDTMTDWSVIVNQNPKAARHTGVIDVSEGPIMVPR